MFRIPLITLYAAAVMVTMDFHYMIASQVENWGINFFSVYPLIIITASVFHFFVLIKKYLKKTISRASPFLTVKQDVPKLFSEEQPMLDGEEAERELLT